MAFGREVQLDIGLNNNLGIRISNLNFTFEVERSVEPENNYCNLTIYNAKQETRDKVLIKDNNVFLRAGHKDENNLGLIFSGIIKQSTTSFENTEYKTEVYSLDFGNATSNIKKQIVDFNFNAGVQFSSIINYLSTIMNVPVIGIDNLSGILLNNGFVYQGTVPQLVKQIQKKLLTYNIGFYFDLGEMVVYNLSTPSLINIVNLTPQSGLIGEVEQVLDDEDDGTKRILFKSLLNPKYKPNTVIRIKSDKFVGGAVIKKLTFRGGNITTEDFIVEGEALVI